MSVLLYKSNPQNVAFLMPSIPNPPPVAPCVPISVGVTGASSIPSESPAPLGLVNIPAGASVLYLAILRLNLIVQLPRISTCLLNANPPFSPDAFPAVKVVKTARVEPPYDPIPFVAPLEVTNSESTLS